MLASDLNNPAFMGAQNPDDLLSVEFYWHEPVDKWASEEQGKIVKRDRMPFVRIMIPGNQNSILETAVTEHHKMRWPQKWLYWQMKEGLIAGEGQVHGWSIEDWPELDEEIRRHLRFLRFQTVEQIAGANDHQVGQMGMGGLALRRKARDAMATRMDSHVREELDKRDAQIEELTKAVAALQAATAPQEQKTLSLRK